jgi:hypothetical protein
MANQVYANGREVSCKAADGKSIAAFPDVCFTPPQTPATPPGVPIPYPNTGLASDTADGSTTVNISGREVMLKNKSFFRRSTGDEAGCAPKKGVVTSTNKGKAYFIAWSMDVKVEGENLVRHLDLTTHNHGSDPGSTPPMTHIASQALSQFTSCDQDAGQVESKCTGDPEPNHCPGALGTPVESGQKNWVRDQLGRPKPKSAPVTVPSAAAAMANHANAIVPPMSDSSLVLASGLAEKDADASPCAKAMRCYLRPFNATPMDGKSGCCPGQTPHHIPPKTLLNGVVSDYNENTALCVCLEGMTQHVGSHGKNHRAIDYLADRAKAAGKIDTNNKCSLDTYNEICAATVAAQCGCQENCIKAQLDKSFTQKQRDTKITHKSSNSKQPINAFQSNLDIKYNVSNDTGFTR